MTLVEVGVLVTDAGTNILSSGVEFVIKPGDESPAGALENMNDFVRSMHEASGLLPDIEHGVDGLRAGAGASLHQEMFPVAGKAAGNARWAWIALLGRYMPRSWRTFTTV